MNKTKNENKEMINKAAEYHIPKVKEYLKQVEGIENLIKSNQSELEKLEKDVKELCGIDYSKDKVKSTFVNNAGYTKTIEKIIALDDAINDDIDRLFKLKLEIRTTINSVENYNERVLLRNKYLLFMSWEDICASMKISSRTVHRIHSEALNNFKIPQNWQ